MKIGLLGHGVVGGGVSRIIDTGRSEEVKQLEVVKILVKDESECTDERCTTNADDILNDPEIDAVCECMGGLEPAHTFVKRALEAHKHAVTSNKKMLANYFDELLSIAEENGVQLLYEATAGGGIPWMANLRSIRRIDEVDRFRGIFNGTTNYMLSHMESEQADFDEMLEKAQSLGYAERDPSDDIDGFDVRYKVMLSAAAAFDAVIDPAEIITFGIRNIRKGDIAWANEHGKSVKLIGSAEYNHKAVKAKVMPVMLDNQSWLAHIPENLNGIECESDTLGPAGFIGQGAGSLPTAHAVVQDLLTLENYVSSGAFSTAKEPVDISSLSGRYYIRTEKPEVFEAVIAEKIDDHALLSKETGLEEIAALVKAADDSTLFIAEVEE